MSDLNIVKSTLTEKILSKWGAGYGALKKENMSDLLSIVDSTDTEIGLFVYPAMDDPNWNVIFDIRTKETFPRVVMNGFDVAVLLS